MIGHPIHPDAAVVLRKLGGDPSKFSARQVTAKIASDADLIVTMTKDHRDAVLQLAPRQLRKTFTLTEAYHLITTFGPKSIAALAEFRPRITQDLLDIPDPIAQDMEIHLSVGTQISQLLPPILELCQGSRAVKDS